VPVICQNLTSRACCQDVDGNRVSKLDGVRVQCVACLPDNRTVLAADAHKRVRAYVFDDQQDSTLVYVIVLLAVSVDPRSGWE